MTEHDRQEAARDAAELLARYAAQTETALDAAERADTEALAAALDARDLVIRELPALQARLAAFRDMKAGRGAERAETGRLLATLLEAGIHVARDDVRLLRIAGGTRDALAAQLDQPAPRATGHATGYAPASGGRLVNVVR